LSRPALKRVFSEIRHMENIQHMSGISTQSMFIIQLINQILSTNHRENPEEVKRNICLFLFPYYSMEYKYAMVPYLSIVREIWSVNYHSINYVLTNFHRLCYLHGRKENIPYGRFSYEKSYYHFGRSDFSSNLSVNKLFATTELRAKPQYQTGKSLPFRLIDKGQCPSYMWNWLNNHPHRVLIH